MSFGNVAPFLGRYRCQEKKLKVETLCLVHKEADVSKRGFKLKLITAANEFSVSELLNTVQLRGLMSRGCCLQINC